MRTGAKTDLKRDLGSYRATHGRFDVVTVPPRQYLMYDGRGDPNTARSYLRALGALYPVAYALKFFSKRELDRDYTVMPLEGLWWADDPELFTTRRDKDAWSWTLMILVPDWLERAHVEQARAAALAKGVSGVGDIRVERLDEGLCVQTLHIGSFDDEASVLAELHGRVIPDRGLRMTGRHHEIYLSDARRAAPEKLRTILRQPVEVDAGTSPTAPPR
ncbi:MULTISPECIES: GyrI-like domain-containing protein [Microbacterium]|uniref:GyrI-like domain-containing protein n=1 Tax=Microbacterium TaxID=33882 RepID=UPI001EF4BBCD|nr:MULTISPECIES: GyrI-like domain-containing protein [Microbacterium]MBZ6372461.1 GyrI-like domain-containing protein [Microbacterium hominis]MCG7414706.1 GyrI-like domain-containing protein [Microbacterium aurum]